MELLGKVSELLLVGGMLLNVEGNVTGSEWGRREGGGRGSVGGGRC